MASTAATMPETKGRVTAPKTSRKESVHAYRCPASVDRPLTVRPTQFLKRFVGLIVTL
jgi:hypothetical protein